MITKHWKDRKPISIRFKPKQEEYFQKIIKLLKEKTGDPVSRTWIIKKMMAYGQEEFHKEFKISFEILRNMKLEENNN